MTLSNRRILSLDHRWNTDINQRRKKRRILSLGHRWITGVLANLHTVPISQQSNHQILSLGHRWITDITDTEKKVRSYRWANVGLLALTNGNEVTSLPTLAQQSNVYWERSRMF